MTRLHITEKHTGKMKGMQSLSTSCRTNPYCAEHAKVEGSICRECYANTMLKMWKNLDACAERNAEILKSGIIPDDELPVINVQYFRFESFGDLINTTQVINYFNICKKNPNVKFALWTKNPFLITPVADQKPDNLQIVISSLYLNQQINADHLSFVDKVFTVYDGKTIDEKGIDINCGARSCLTCHKCYMADGPKYINEELKSDQKKRKRREATK